MEFMVLVFVFILVRIRFDSKKKHSIPELCDGEIRSNGVTCHYLLYDRLSKVSGNALFSKFHLVLNTNSE